MQFYCSSNISKLIMIFFLPITKMKTVHILAFTVVFAIGLYVVMSRKSEGFVDLKQSYTVENKAQQQVAAHQAQLTGHLDNEKFMTRPSYRPDVPPRTYSGSYVGELRGAMPPLGMQAVPAGPMDHSEPDVEGATKFAAMVGVENLQQADGLEGYSEGEINDMIYEKYGKPLEYDDPSETLPGQDMSSVKYGKLASDPDTYVYDRLLYVNQKRRTSGAGDWIRGDLAIVPENRGWFSVSAIPHLDLRRGAVGGGHVGPDMDTEVDEFGGIQMSRDESEGDMTVSRWY